MVQTPGAGSVGRRQADAHRHIRCNPGGSRRRPRSPVSGRVPPRSAGGRPPRAGDAGSDAGIGCVDKESAVAVWRCGARRVDGLEAGRLDPGGTRPDREDLAGCGQKSPPVRLAAPRSGRAVPGRRSNPSHHLMDRSVARRPRSRFAPLAKVAGGFRGVPPPSGPDHGHADAGRLTGGPRKRTRSGWPAFVAGDRVYDDERLRTRLGTLHISK